MPIAITSTPLTVAVTKKGTAITVTDADGQVVMDGVRGKAAEPATAVLTTASSTWTITEKQDGVRQVLDPAGLVVAEIRGNGWTHDTIYAGDGSEIPSKGHRSLVGYGASFGSLAAAKAPMVMPKRPFKLILSEGLLARPDHEMLVAVFAHIARQKIISSVRSAASSSVPS